jgi:hypothetical protein
MWLGDGPIRTRHQWRENEIWVLLGMIFELWFGELSGLTTDRSSFRQRKLERSTRWKFYDLYNALRGRCS